MLTDLISTIIQFFDPPVNSQQSTVNNNSGATGIDMSDAVWVGSLPTVAFLKLVLFAQRDFIYLPDRARITPN